MTLRGFAFVVTMAAADSALAAPPVLIRSTAEPEYLAARAVKNPAKPETYVFYRGKYFPGPMVDRTLERMPFIEIAQGLAPYLKRRNYLPAKKMAEADLILVVHWGTTVGRNRAAALATYNLGGDSQTKLIGAAEDLDAARSAAAISGLAQTEVRQMMTVETRADDLGRERGSEIEWSRLDRDLSVTSNAALLGLGDLFREGQRAMAVSTTTQTIESMLDEDRYFIIVVAYDLPRLIEKKIARRVWSARISVRAAGVNFREAATYLGIVGGDFFGKPSDGLDVQTPVAAKAEVSIGDLKVIETDAGKR